MKRVAQSLIALLIWGSQAATAGDDKWLVGTSSQSGLPIVIKVVDELPNSDVRKMYRWLTVISWTFDRDSRNGMPPENVNKQMIALEDAIAGMEKSGLYRSAYTRTGNGIKEFAIYIVDRERFMAAFNEALSKHPRYPLSINFYEDAAWKDYQEMRQLFKNKQ